MNDLKKKWLITGGVFVFAAALTVLAGIGISKMTGTKKSEVPETEAAAAVTDPAEPDENASRTESRQAETDQAPQGSEAPAESGSEAPQGSEASESGPETPQSSETPAESGSEPSSEDTPGNDQQSSDTPPETEPPVPAVAVHALSAEEIADIRANYSDAEQGFYTGESDRDEQNRAKSCVTRDQLLNSSIGNVLIFGPETEQPTVYLTFILTNEFAPNTEDLLNILANLNVKALFLTDRPYVEHNLGLVQRMIQEGHEIGSIGNSLPDGGLVKLGLEAMCEDIYAFHTFMQETCSYNMRKFYFSYDVYTEQAVAAVVKMGYQVVFYSANYVDYDHYRDIDVNNLLMSLQYQTHPGCIYSLHTTNRASVEVIQNIVPWLWERGYTVGRLP